MKFRLLWPLLATLCATLVAATVVTASEHGATVSVDVLVDDLEHPWSLAFLPGGDLLITERAGSLRRLSQSDFGSRVITGTPDVVARGQGGLLDVAIDPDFQSNRLVYLCYSGEGDGGAGSEVVRGVLAGDRLTNLTSIFTAQPKTRGSSHYGCRLAFDAADHLFISLGDRGGFMDQAQVIDNHLGTIVRLRANGALPDDNPFIQGEAPEIYSYGHRNVQGMAIRPSDGSLWAHEHGPRGGDELNRVRPGVNYGWPAITYGINYDGRPISDQTEAPGLQQPVTFWDPSIAPSGMAFYAGDAFPEWSGDLLIGSLKFRHLRRLEMDGDEVVAEHELLRDRNRRIRDVRVGPDGLIYVLTDHRAGELLRLSP